PIRGRRQGGILVGREDRHRRAKRRAASIKKGTGTFFKTQADNKATEGVMKEKGFKGRIRKILQNLGVSAQRGIEKRVGQALAEGRLKGNEKFPAKATVTLGGIGFSHEIKGEIELE